MTQNIYRLSSTLMRQTQIKSITVRLYGRWTHRKPAKILLPFEPDSNTSLKKEKIIHLDSEQFKSKNYLSEDIQDKPELKSLVNPVKFKEIKDKRDTKEKKRKFYLGQKKVFDDNGEIIYEKLKENDGRIRLLAEWVNFPATESARRSVAAGFEDKYNVPDILGVIDCTHIKIFSPPGPQGAHYKNRRKDAHTINVQLVIDANCRILNVNARYPGRVHDAFIWHHSSVRCELKRLHERRIGNYFLLGDSGYPLEPWLMTPILHAEVNTPEKNYTDWHCQARNAVERANGYLKGSLRCLGGDRILHYAPPKSAEIIYACCIIFNIMKHFGNLLVKLKIKKERLRTSQMLVEGWRLIVDGLEAKCALKYVIFSRTEDLNHIRPFLPKTGVQIFKIPYKEIELWSDVETSSGIFGVFEMPTVENINRYSRPIPLQFICDNIRTPGNLGAILRAAVGVGCEKVILTKGCVDLWDPKVIRSASGAHFRQPIHTSVDWNEMLNLLDINTSVFIADNNTNVNAESESESESSLPVLPYYGVDFADLKHVTLVIGSETEGISEDSYRLAAEKKGVRLNIPLQKGVDSLNTGMAAAVIAFEIRKQFIQYWSKRKLENQQINVT